MDEPHRTSARRTGHRGPPLWIPLVMALVLHSIVVGRFVAAFGTEGATAATTGTATEPSITAVATTASGAPTQAPSVAGLPACSVDDLPAPDAGYDGWARTLVDTAFRLPATYQPPDLDSVEEAGFENDALLVRSFVLPGLSALRDAAEDAGHPIGLIAAFRSFTVQKDLFDRRIQSLGPEGALDRTAQPGHSEHQLGTTIDVAALGAKDVTQGFGSTPTGRWLAENAYRFGFVQSYPRGRSGVTCYAYEPWHYRYVGRTEAERVHASGLTLREFLWREDHPAG